MEYEWVCLDDYLGYEWVCVYDYVYDYLICEWVGVYDYLGYEWSLDIWLYELWKLCNLNSHITNWFCFISL